MQEAEAPAADRDVVDVNALPTRFTASRGTRNGCLYSVAAAEMCIMMSNTRSVYGREARMRSWAFFIFEAATISMALVILRVLCTLLILLRISLVPAMRRVLPFPPGTAWLRHRFPGS